MFDFLAALRPYNGYLYNFKEFRKLMAKLRLDNLGDISPEFGIQEMMEISITRGWAQEDNDGNMRIVLGAKA